MPDSSIKDGLSPSPESFEDAVKRLAALPASTYDRTRKTEANALGVRVTTLDRAREEFCKPSVPPHVQPEPLKLAEDEFIIEPGAPMRTAELLISKKYTHSGLRALHHQQGLFRSWTGTYYREVLQEELRSDVYKFLNKSYALDGEGYPRKFNPKTTPVNEILDATAAITQLDSTVQAPSWLSKHTTKATEFVACANGLLHLESGKILPHTPDYYATSALEYAYDANAPEPEQWIKFLENIWGDDFNSIATLQDIFGYLLGSDTNQQKLFLIVGPKRSGKGTIARILNELLGHAAVVSPTLASLETNFGLAPLVGKSVAIIADARLGRNDQARIAERLLSISGEDSQMVDRKFLPPYLGKLGVRFVVMTNELPNLSDASGALASRFVVLQMKNSFYGKEDLTLGMRLQKELPGILNWAIQGWRNLRARGYFIQPPASAEAIQDLEDLASPIGAFVREWCDVAPGYGCEINALYERWVAWCTEQGRDHPGTKATMGRNLKAAIPSVRQCQPREGDDRLRMYDGIRIKEAFEKPRENIIWQKMSD